MKPITIRPLGNESHRYGSEEMSGPLPQVLYKVLPTVYAKRLVEDGEMMWSTLTWFQNHDDIYRGDSFEGSRRYFPLSGLEINRLRRNGRADLETFTMSAHGMVSKAAQSNHIYIYSLTLDPELDLGNPGEHACVEIFDPVTFTKQVRDGMGEHRKARPETLIHDAVRYWNAEHPPENVWPLPHLLTMYKDASFEWQREYRLAFGTRANVFDFGNVECSIVGDGYEWPQLTPDPQAHRKRVYLADPERCCRMRS